MQQHVVVSDSARRLASAHDTRCRICGALIKHTFIDLGMSPLCERVLGAEQLYDVEPFYPLHAVVCHRCFLVQLGDIGSESGMLHEDASYCHAACRMEEARQYCHMIKQRLRLGSKSLVVELAGNDGLLLQHFQPLGVPVLAIGPAAMLAARAPKLPTLIATFGATLADKLVANKLMPDNRRADLIIANNVLTQVCNLNDFLAGMQRLLAPEGVITVEVAHLQRLMAENACGTIHHAQISYFSFLSIDVLAERHGLKLIDVEVLATRGGSLRVYMAHASSARVPSPRVNDLLEHEIDKGLLDIATYARAGEQVRRSKRSLLSFLIACKEQGKRVCGFGATGAGVSFLNAYGIGADFLDFTVDPDPIKHGRFTPGLHIPIRPVAAIDEAMPDYLLVLPWASKIEIVRGLRHVAAWGCRFIVPLPEIQLIDPSPSHT